MNNIFKVDPDDDIPTDIRYQLACRINQSIVLAEEFLKKNRPDDLLNNIIKINGQDIDMYDYLIVKNNIRNGDFAIVALSSDDNMWFVRKTYDGLIQYYNYTTDDKYNINDLFGLFIKSYKQRLYL
jgi:hypothetical protein